MGNWQMYAALTGSAMAMATSASAYNIGNAARDATIEPIAGVTVAKQHLASARNIPLMNAVTLAIAKKGSGKISVDGAGLQTTQANSVHAPSISAVVPIFGTTSIVQPGEWISIYGSNLAGASATWNGDFPISLGGTSVSINGKAAYLMFVSPGQINLQAPDDPATGVVSVVVTAAGGSAASTVTLSRFAPSLGMLDAKNQFGFISGIILRSDGSGTQGGGAYDILGPTGNSFGYQTVAAKAGDNVELFAVGLGPTDPNVPAGEAFSGSAPITSTFALHINDILVQPAFVGLSSAGLYQINLTVPAGLGEGEVPIHATVGGMRTQKGALFSLQSASGGSGVIVTGGSTVPFNTFFFSSGGGGIPGGTGGGTGGGMPGGSGGGTGGGAPPGGTGGGTGGVPPGGGGGTGGGGTGGGTGGGPAVVHGKKPYVPRLRYPK